jgi:alkylation response protein AidB-like acyl-CoA dehydrogenase
VGLWSVGSETSQQLPTSARGSRQASDDGSPESLFSAGLSGPHVDAYREEIRDLIRRLLVPLLPEAERRAEFPRAAAEGLAKAGAFRARWPANGPGDHGKATIFAEELGRAGVGGLGAGITVQLEAVLSMLLRFGTSTELRRYADGVLDGELIGCVAATEVHAGSDLGQVRTVAVREGGGWRIEGVKRYSSPAGAADFVLVLCKLDQAKSPLITVPLAVALIPKDGFSVTPLKTSGVRSLGTAGVRVNAHVPDELIVGGPGRGIGVITSGFTHERLAAAAQAVGVSLLALALATTHLQRRRQFGGPLFEQQALRLRLARLASETDLVRRGVYAISTSPDLSRQRAVRDIAGAKVTAALLSERVVSECMHLFGGLGYLEDATPLPRLLRDCRLARLGAGTDEMMWEFVAGDLQSDDELYDEWISDE